MIPLKAGQCTIGNEELPMTLQVGMLGTNGVLIAGDTRLSRDPQPGIDAPWQFYNGPKILISESRRIAVSCAHCMQTGKEIAAGIFTGMTHGDHPACEQQIREIALSACRGRNVECFIAFSDPLPSLYVFRYGKRDSKDDIESQRIISCAATGDTRNPAVFWGMSYYRLLPLDQLKHLAACMVASAAELNSALINGLEMVYCTQEGCQRVPDESTRALEISAKTRMVQVGDLVLNGNVPQ